jgi:NhaP-type Na+/H+ or K+/H+ antiporter
MSKLVNVKWMPASDQKLETEKVASMQTIYAVGMTTVFMSVLAHGISAAPLADRYGRYISDLDEKGKAAAETAAVPELPTRSQSVLAKSYTSS